MTRLCEACGSIMRRRKTWVYRCTGCGFLASTLPPAQGTGIPGLEALRRRNFELLLDRVNNIRPLAQSRLLEVGSARGWFLEAASRRGATVRGIEPELANAAPAKQRGLVVDAGFFPDDLEDRGPYDIIVFNDVFEHLPKPSTVIQVCEQLLQPGGLVVVNLPTSDGILFKIATVLDAVGSRSWLKRLWQYGAPSPHVSYFNARNLEFLVSRHTALRRVTTFSLDSVAREGLAARVRASHRAVSGTAAVVGLWLLSFLLPLLPRDIHVSVFQKATDPGTRILE